MTQLDRDLAIIDRVRVLSRGIQYHKTVAPCGPDSKRIVFQKKKTAKALLSSLLANLKI